MLNSSNVAYSQISSIFHLVHLLVLWFETLIISMALLWLALQDAPQGPCMLKRLSNGRYKRIQLPLLGSSMGIYAYCALHMITPSISLLLEGFPGRVIKYKVEDVEGEIVFTQEPPITGIPSSSPDYGRMNYIIISSD